jgi:hypothetical protein
MVTEIPQKMRQAMPGGMGSDRRRSEKQKARLSPRLFHDWRQERRNFRNLKSYPAKTE